MISIPVSFLLAAVFLGLGLSALMWRTLPTLSRGFFVGLFVLLAMEAGLVGLRFAYGVFDFLALQRVLPVWIAPTLYLAFAALTMPDPKAKKLVLLNGAVALAFSVAVLFPLRVDGFVDGLIGLSFAIYCFALVLIWSGGPDRMSQVPTGQSRFVFRLLVVAILAMAASMATDIWIALLFAQQMQEHASLLISYASLAFLMAALALAVMSLRQKSSRRPSTNKARGTPEKQTLVERARQILIEQNLYCDASLSLTRLARRAGTPDRELSLAINDVAGMNVSQFVNQVRLDEAARMLTETDKPVTRIHEEVGFLTRSNFYREFQRQFGEAPGAYRKKAHSSSASSSR
ncbi:AraC family transcriptional regulator [uncultured Roseibium sp.]|uniref:helix-turn-helix transcriptional regulator n=1 Tax=uncultured Roseibium sp. TaxID=1936171 RepID=UPI002635DD32|nr:AraC family transcriptional regulator [uncultured Roseibium sp.]